jgi:hypothetical protein
MIVDILFELDFQQNTVPSQWLKAGNQQPFLPRAFLAKVGKMDELR